MELINSFYCLFSNTECSVVFPIWIIYNQFITGRFSKWTEFKGQLSKHQQYENGQLLTKYSEL